MSYYHRYCREMYRHNHRSNDCVCDTVKDIIRAQNKVKMMIAQLDVILLLKNYAIPAMNMDLDILLSHLFYIVKERLNLL